MSTQTQDWIASDPTAIADDIERLGLEDAADYQMSLIADRADSGDHRWDEITAEQMLCALTEI